MLGDQFVVLLMNLDLENNSIPAMANFYFLSYWEYFLLVKMKIHIVLEIRGAKLPLVFVEKVEEGGV